MNRIKELRARSGESQAELAGAVNVSPSAMSGYETGKFQADIPIYFAIAKHFGVSLDYLLGGDEDPKPGRKDYFPPFPEATDRFSRLDEVDRIRVLAYMDGILSGEKYSTQTKRSAG